MRQGTTTGRSNPHSWGQQTDLFISIRNAEKAKIITVDEAGYLRDLAENIEWGLDRPISCLRVCDAEQIRGWSGEKFRRLRVSLERKGMVINTMSANGARYRCKHDAAGLDLSPLLNRRDELTQRAKTVHVEMRKRQKLFAEIRLFRGRIQRAQRQGAELSASLAKAWESLPRRVSELATDALEKLLTKIETLWKTFAAALSHPTNQSDVSHSEHEQNTDTNNNNYNRNYEQTRAEAGHTPDQETMKAAMDLLRTACEAEPEMQDMAESYTQARGFEGMVMFLTELAMLGGAPRYELTVARSRMGIAEFCGMCLMVWAKSPRNKAMPSTLHIRNPAAWVNAMGQKAERGKANIAASLKGLRKSWEEPVRRCV